MRTIEQRRLKEMQQVNEDLIQRTLIPYQGKNTDYLKSVSIISPEIDLTQGQLSQGNEYIVRGDFKIIESCYIEDTGHFNAVEFNLCFNQLFYVAIAYACSIDSLDFLIDLTLEDFYIKQLPNIYITRLESHYKKQIDAKDFFGILSFKKIKKIKGMTICKTEIKFMDQRQGLAYGAVDVVIT